MQNYINNYNYQYQVLEENLSENLLYKLNDIEHQTPNEIDSNATLFQYQNDIFGIEYSQKKFNICKYEFEENYNKCEIGEISLQCNKKYIQQNQFEQKDFKFKFKNQTLVIGIMENKIIYDIFFGKFTFPEINLHKITEAQDSSKISFANNLTSVEYQQIEVHPTIPNMIITLSVETGVQYFSIYCLQIYSETSQIIKLFTQKSQNMLLCEIINFYIDYFNHEVIYFTNIFAHLFQINFSELIKSISKVDTTNTNQQYLYKKLHIFHFKSQSFQVYTQPINEKQIGNCIYFQKLPKNDNYFLFFFQTNEVIELVLIKLNQSKSIILLSKEITAIQEQKDKLQKLIEQSQKADLEELNEKNILKKQREQIFPIQKYLQNQNEIDYLYFYCKQILIQIQINQEINVRTLSFDSGDNMDLTQDTEFLSIDQAIPLDFCYYHFLILKINSEDYSTTNKSYQYILFKYDTLEMPMLNERTMENRYEYETYKENKSKIKYLREMIQKYKENIQEINSLENLNNLEEEIYLDITQNLNPIVESIGTKKDINKKKDENDVIFQIYQYNNEIMKILNDFDYQSNMRKYELSQLKISLLFDQYQIQQNQQEKIKQQLQQRKINDEKNLKQQIINKILSIDYQQFQDRIN
ncbi:unnamed protein product [Paramecium sonneborni]|uniref:Uncharacterized protein n=1 Tax=Paramecium sonneborni TaxID=65129 RepID=A0A8S1KCU4_9CILI|nr:unnamed protein product [Paramecium sonneborni]